MTMTLEELECEAEEAKMGLNARQKHFKKWMSVIWAAGVIVMFAIAMTNLSQ